MAFRRNHVYSKYWRVINKNDSLVANYPGGVEHHAAHLQEESFTIETGAKAPKVKNFAASLAHFG